MDSTSEVSLLGMVWILTIFQPYAKRMRNIIMSYYHPEVAKQRAVWLYNHILRSRGNFLTYIRRQLRRKFGLRDKQPHDRVTLVQRCFAFFPFLDWLFGQERGKVCLLCGQPETPDETLIKCPTVGCIGIYCKKCYADLKNTCTICLRPIDYGDLSDISEEKDSSDDDDDDDRYLANSKVHADADTASDDADDANDRGGNGNLSDSEDDETRSIHTNGTSDTQFSYSYQDQEFAKNGNASLSVRPHFKDLEAQKSLTYASSIDLLSADKKEADSISSTAVKKMALITYFHDNAEEFAIVMESKEVESKKSSPLLASLLDDDSRKINKSLILKRYFDKFENCKLENEFEEKLAHDSISPHELTQFVSLSNIGGNHDVNDTIQEVDGNEDCLLFTSKVDKKQLEAGDFDYYSRSNNSKNQFEKNESNKHSALLSIASRLKFNSTINGGGDSILELKGSASKHERLDFLVHIGTTDSDGTSVNDRTSVNDGTSVSDGTLFNDGILVRNRTSVNNTILNNDATSAKTAVDANSVGSRNSQAKKETKFKDKRIVSGSNKLKRLSKKTEVAVTTCRKFIKIISDESGLGSSETSMLALTSDNI